MATWPTGDICVSMFGAVYATGALVFPQGARVLEVGCAEGDWQTPMLAARPDLRITGIDWRDVEPRPGACVRGDVLTHDWPKASFDVMVGISSIEHIGLGHYDDDPLDEDGDRHCMERVARWLAPGGWAYLDVPYADAYSVEGTSHRVYNRAAFLDRLIVPSLRLHHTWYATSNDRSLSEEPRAGDDARDMAYVVLVATRD